MWMWIRSLMVLMLKGVGALALCGAILWQVVEHCGTTKGTLYVHVPKTPANVTVDDETYRVESLYESPIVCELRPGRHTLRMIRGGQAVFEQEFALGQGEEIVMTVWDEPTRKRDDARLADTSPTNRPVSLSRLARRNP